MDGINFKGNATNTLPIAGRGMQLRESAACRAHGPDPALETAKDWPVVPLPVKMEPGKATCILPELHFCWQRVAGGCRGQKHVVFTGRGLLEAVVAKKQSPDGLHVASPSSIFIDRGLQEAIMDKNRAREGFVWPPPSFVFAGKWLQEAITAENRASMNDVELATPSWSCPAPLNSNTTLMQPSIK
ncbi:hypothetical protein L345_08477, partial [Ophiophagus hannah]